MISCKALTVFNIREYWVYKYNEAFDAQYKPKSFAQEVIMLKRLLAKYNQYVILEATDRFFQEASINIASINFFASQKVFDNKFSDIIKMSEIMKYKRFLQLFPQEIKDKVSNLIREYHDYTTCEVLSEEEKFRKIKTIEEIKNLADGYFTEGTGK